MSAPLSFKIRAPSTASTSRIPPPPSRPTNKRKGGFQNESDSSEDERNSKQKDELVTGFDKAGLTRKHKIAVEAPLIIASLPNLDWRKVATDKNGKKRNNDRYIPDSAGSMRVGGSGEAINGRQKTQGGMGTTDTINSEPVVGGLAITSNSAKELPISDELDTTVPMEIVETVEKVVETLDQKALRELLAGQKVEREKAEELILLSAADDRGGPLEQGDAFKRDLDSRPDESSLEDYARVPVGTFGLALLRGMGWQQGTAASRTGRKGPVEAFIPKSRPSLLGIGATPMAEVIGKDDKKGKGKGVGKRDSMKFVPLMRVEKELNRESSSSRRSRSPPPNKMRAIEDKPRNSDRNRDESRRRDRSPYRERERDRDSHRSSDRRDRDKGSERSNDSRDDRRYEKGSRDSNSRDSRRDSDRDSRDSRRDSDRDRRRDSDRR